VPVATRTVGPGDARSVRFSLPPEAHVSKRHPLARILIGLGLLCGLVLALASSVILNGAPLLLVLIAATMVGGLAYGIRDASRSASLEAAWRAAAVTISVIVVAAGGVVLVGAAATMAIGALAAVAGGAMLLVQYLRARSTDSGADRSAPPGGEVPGTMLPMLQLDRAPAPVALLPTVGLAREWSESTAALAASPDPKAWQALVRRRHEVLDEMELRDPRGVARWLAMGAAADSSPEKFLEQGPAPGAGAA
jgi:hypothetical protein